MSFLKSAPKAQALPLNYTASDCAVKLEVVPVPKGHSAVDDQKLIAQKKLIAQLENEEPGLFEEKACIVKTVDKERQYKQAAEFKSSVTLESLQEIMEENDLCLKVKFVRPGFNSSNNVYMVSANKLESLFEENSDSNLLKKTHLSIGEVDNHTGFATLTVREKMPSRQHVAYSVDFTMHEVDDERMRCEYK